MANQTTTTRKPATGTTAGGATAAPSGNLPAAQGNGNAPAAREPTTRQLQMQRLKNFEGFMMQNQEQLLTSLPDYISPPHFISVVKTALQNKPSLLDCTFQSLWNACIRAAQDGLLPDGREGAIAPYGDNGDGPKKTVATWLPMIAGYRKQARNAGIKDWRVEVVYERDVFEYEKGDEPRIIHRPYCGPGGPGNVIAAYSIAKLENGEISREVMTRFELDQVRSKSKALTNGPWSVPEFIPEMYKKTVARRHFKQLPRDTVDYAKLDTLSKIIDHDDNEFGPDFGAADTALPAPAGRRTPAGVLDQIAGPQDGEGQTIDHDPDTGEATDDGSFVEETAKTEPKPDAKPPARQRAKPDTPASGQKPASGAPTGKTTEAPAPAADAAGASDSQDDDGFGPSEDTAGPDDMSPVNDAVMDALNDAPATSATTGEKQADGGPVLATQAELSAEDQLHQMWDNGDEPKTRDEYFNYLAYVMPLNLKVSGEVGPWFSSAEQKKIRDACGVAADPDFTTLLNMAKKHRSDLIAKGA